MYFISMFIFPVFCNGQLTSGTGVKYKTLPGFEYAGDSQEILSLLADGEVGEQMCSSRCSLSSNCEAFFIEGTSCNLVPDKDSIQKNMTGPNYYVKVLESPVVTKPPPTIPAAIIKEKDIPTAENTTDTENKNVKENENEDEEENEKENEETTTIVPLFLYSRISFKDDCNNWVSGIDKNQINLKATPSGNATLNLKMYTKTKVNSAKIVKGPGKISVNDERILIRDWDIQFGPDKPLDISFEVYAGEEDEGKPLVVTKMTLGKWLKDEENLGYMKCGE